MDKITSSTWRPIKGIIYHPLIFNKQQEVLENLLQLFELQPNAIIQHYEQMKLNLLKLIKKLQAKITSHDKNHILKLQNTIKIAREARQMNPTPTNNQVLA